MWNIRTNLHNLLDLIKLDWCESLLISCSLRYLVSSIGYLVNYIRFQLKYSTVTHIEQH